VKENIEFKGWISSLKQELNKENISLHSKKLAEFSNVVQESLFKGVNTQNNKYNTLLFVYYSTRNESNRLNLSNVK